MKPLFLIDGDGVMLDYNQAFKDHYEKIYNKTLILKNPKAYQAVEACGLDKMSEEDYKYFKNESAKLGMWENMPALPGALEFVNEISKYFKVWCLTSMPQEHEQDRLKNLQKLGFPIEKVIATSRIGNENPKKKFIENLNPVYFMDDLLQNFVDIDSKIKTKLIFLDWKSENSPNKEYGHINPHITINNYEDFFSLSEYYINKKKYLKIELNMEESPYINNFGKIINQQYIPISLILKEEIYYLHQKYNNYYLEGEFTDNDFDSFFKIIEKVKEEMKDWTIDYADNRKK